MIELEDRLAGLQCSASLCFTKTYASIQISALRVIRVNRGTPESVYQTSPFVYNEELKIKEVRKVGLDIRIHVIKINNKGGSYGTRQSSTEW